MLPGDSPAATCSYGEGFLSQTLGKQLQPEPLSACPAFIRRKSIRKNKHSSSLCTHIPGPAVRGRPGAPRWCPKPGTAPSLALGLLGSKGGHTTSAKGFSLFPSPARGHIPSSKSSGQTQKPDLMGFASQRDSFPAGSGGCRAEL